MCVCVFHASHGRFQTGSLKHPIEIPTVVPDAGAVAVAAADLLVVAAVRVIVADVVIVNRCCC